MRIKKSHRPILFLGIAVAFLFFFTLLTIWISAPSWVDDPLPKLQTQTPVRIWQDRNGKPIWYERTYDYQWRFAIPLAEISPHTIRVMLAAEDAKFYEHSGVDYAAVLRAAWQNFWNGRIISGASTISMQLAGMTLSTNEHGFSRKWKQSILARKMETCHSKQEILEEYLNRIPFGGKLYGIEAAARYYFGLHAADLNLTESTLLCGLPQKPNRLRPDRHLDAAKERQRIILQLLVTHGQMSAEEADHVLHNEPLRLRDFQIPAEFEQLSTPNEFTHFIQMSKRTSSSATLSPTNTSPITLSIDRELQDRSQQLLRMQCEYLDDVQDAAAILMNNHTGEILVYIGTLDFQSPDAGQVDSVRSIRSAGSTLKPFIYAEAIDAGQIVAATKLNDTPLRYGDYAPGNYDKKYFGKITVAYALSHSLNTPVIQLLAKLGTERILDTFDKIGLTQPLSQRGEQAGLSLALGTIGHTLLDITLAYSVLANEGTLLKPNFHPSQTPEPERTHIYSPQTCQMISMILYERPLPNSTYQVAWKTGTSNNNCDAWCIAYTPEYTLGIWFGNKNGKPSPQLVGVTAAAPIAGEIFDHLYRNKQNNATHSTSPQWFDEQQTFELRELCSISGLTPGTFCTQREKQYAIPDLPLADCKTCTQTSLPVFKILSPAPEQYVTMGRKTITLPIKTNLPNPTHWFLNGRTIGMNLTEYEFKANQRYTLRAVLDPDPNAPDTPPLSAEISFSIEK